jgi:transcriptional repressor NrdR
MEGLRTLDAVAYVRYSSVYKDFRDAHDFSELIGRLAAEEQGRVPADEAPERSDA